jgi:hypothetical protein
MLGALMSHRPACIVSRVVRARHLCFLACLAWIACALLAAPARADGPPGASSAPTVAIIRIDLTGDHPPDLMEQLDVAMVRALAAVGFAGLSHDSVQAKIRGNPGLADCASPECLRQLPALLGTNQFLRLRVEASSAIYEFELLLLVADGEGGSIKDRRKDTCPVCTSEEFIDRVADNLRGLMEPFQPVSVTLDSQPPGARLTVDGRELGSAPFSGMLAPGPHQVRAALAGHLDAEQVIEVAAGKSDAPQRFDVGLTAAPSGGGGGGGGGSTFGMWKWPTAVAAVGVVAAGGYWLSIEGDCVKEPAVSGGQCERFYGTQAQGIIAIVAGAALGGAAGLMFWSDSSSAAETETGSGSAFAPDIVPTRGGAMGTLRFRF